MSNLESSSSMADKIKTEDPNLSDVLSDFKKAAHALMDAIELGLFKRVEVLDSGALSECGRGPIACVDHLEVKRFMDGELQLTCQFLENSNDTQMKERSIEELRSRKGLFLDERDAQVIQMQDNIRQLKNDQEQAVRRAREDQNEIDKIEAKIAKLKRS